MFEGRPRLRAWFFSGRFLVSRGPRTTGSSLLRARLGPAFHLRPRDSFDRRHLLRRTPSSFRRAGRKLETHLAVGTAYQERRERPALSGNEPVQEIGPSRGKQLLYLLGLDGPLQNDAPRAEVAASRRADAVLADVGARLLEYSAAALRARPEGGEACKIHRFRGSIG